MHAPVALGEIAVAGYDVVMVAHATVTARIIAAAMPPQARSVAIIGPEGGFADDEVARLAETRGVVPVSLGPRILRAETAAVVAVTLALAVTGGMEPPQPRDWTNFNDA